MVKIISLAESFDTNSSEHAKDITFIPKTLRVLTPHTDDHTKVIDISSDFSDIINASEQEYLGSAHKKQILVATFSGVTFGFIIGNIPGAILGGVAFGIAGYHKDM